MSRHSCAVLSVRPGSRRSSGGYSLANRRLYSSAFSTREKGAMGPLLSAPAGASKRESPTSNLTESTACARKVQDILQHTNLGIVNQMS